MVADETQPCNEAWERIRIPKGGVEGSIGSVSYSVSLCISGALTLAEYS